MKVYALIFSSFALLSRAFAEQCGLQADGDVCPEGLCCSQYGWCGSTIPYCGPGCQSQCRLGGGSAPPRGDVGKLISVGVFNKILKYRDDSHCPSKGFYTYKAFLTAAQSFRGFGTTGDDTTCKRELAAFLAQTSHETSGGWKSAPGGPYAWGYCFTRARNQSTFCSPNKQWPCSPGQKYYGRGPIQLTYNYNYGQAGKELKLNLLKNPDLVATNATIAFKTAIWFWMTPQGNKPSSHDVIVGKWLPSDSDKIAGRIPGYGVITNIINGKVECGHGPDKRVADRIGFYKRYCNILGVSYGDDLDCNNQMAFT